MHSLWIRRVGIAVVWWVGDIGLVVSEHGRALLVRARFLIMCFWGVGVGAGEVTLNLMLEHKLIHKNIILSSWRHQLSLLHRSQGPEQTDNTQSPSTPQSQLPIKGEKTAPSSYDIIALQPLK